MDLSIVIVNYNTSQILKSCKEALEAACRDLDYEIFIVDNASPEGFPVDLGKSDGRLLVIMNERNVGFARANNQVLRSCKGDFILLLNPDVEVSSEAVSEMLSFLRRESQAGAVGCKTYWDRTEKFQFSTLKIPDILTALFENTLLGRLFPDNSYFRALWEVDYDAWKSEEPVLVKGLPAAILIIKKEVVEQIGYFDEKFFLYYEDKDLCKRIQDAGYKIYYLPNVAAVHHYAQSTRCEESDALRDNIKRSRAHYYIKHYGWKGILLKFTISFNEFLTESGKRFLGFIRRRSTDCFEGGRELKLSWDKGDSFTQFCLEISVEPHFLHKVGLFLKDSEYTISSSLMSKIPSTNYFWRCIGFKENGEKITLNSGNFLKQ